MYGLGMATMERPPDPDDLADDVADDDDLAGAEGPVDVLGDLGIQAGQIDASQVWPGVLLTPEALATYEELVPGAAERILKMAEQPRGLRRTWRTRGVTEGTSTLGL